MKKRFTLYICLIALCVLHAPTTKTNPLSDFPKNHPYLCAYIGGLAAFSIVSGIIQAQKIKKLTLVGMIPIQGTITSTKQTVDYARATFANPSVKAILLMINSSGGDAAQSQILFEEIIRLKQMHKKPVVALVESVCASGAYYIACAADIIIAPRASIVGSIGVISEDFNYSRLLEKLSVDYTVTKAGKNKACRNSCLPINSDDKQLWQKSINDIYDQFIYDVTTQRPNISLENSKQWAEGKPFTGKQAFEIGLVDQLGSLHTAEQYIKEKLNTNNTIIWLYPKAPSIFEQIAQKIPGMAAQLLTQLGNKISAHI